MQQQMNATHPDGVNSTVQEITKTVLNTEIRLENGGILCMPPIDLLASTQRNQHVETLNLEGSVVGSALGSEHKELKTFHGLNKDNASVTSNGSESMHEVSPKVKIIQESPIIDKNLDTYEPESENVQFEMVSPLNSDVNGNRDSEVSSVIQSNKIDELPITKNPSQS